MKLSPARRYFTTCVLAVFAWANLSQITAQGDAAGEIEKLLDIAQVFEEGDKPDSASIFYREALAMASEINDWDLLLQASLGHYGCLVLQFHLDSALQAIEQLMVKIPETYSNELYLAKLFDLKAKAYHRKGGYHEALEATVHAHRIKSGIGADRHEIMQTLDLQGDAYRSLDQMENARNSYELALALNREDAGLERSVGVAALLADLAILDRIEGDYERAIKRYQEAQNIIENLPGDHWSTLASVFNGLGIIYATIGNHPLALQYFEKLLATDLKRLKPTDPDLARSYTNLAIIHEIMGDLVQSVSLHEQALAIKLETLGEDHPSLLYDYKGLATVYSNIGDIDQTLLYLHKTEPLEAKHMGPDSRNLAMSHNLMGSSYRIKRDFAQAIKYLKSAEEIISARDPNDPQAGAIYHNLSSYYLDHEMYVESEAYARKALEANSANFGHIHPHVAGNHEMLGIIFEKQGNLQLAKSHFEKSLEINLRVDGKAHRNVAGAYAKLANNARLLGNFSRSLQYAQAGIIAGSETFQDTNAQHNPEVSDIPIPKDMASILTIKARAFVDLFSQSKNVGHLQHGLEAFEVAIHCISEAQFSYQSRGSVAHLKETFSATYEHAIEACYLLYEKEGDEIYIDKALQFGELSKATLLVAALNESRARQFSGIPDSLLQRELSLRRDISYFHQLLLSDEIPKDSLTVLSAEIFHLKQSYDLLIREFENNYPQYFALKFDRHTASLDDLRRNILGDGETLISYFAGENNYFGIAIGQHTSDFFRIAESSELADCVTNLTARLKNKNSDLDSFLILSQKLFEILISPIRSELLDKKLAIVPDGVLNYLPFEILIPTDPIHDNQFTFDLPYLFTRHAMSYAYSATFLKQMMVGKTQRDNQPKFLAYAPIFVNRDEEGVSTNQPLAKTLAPYRGELTELSGARDEVTALSQYFKGKFLEDRLATEHHFKINATHFGILHLATHAIIDDLNPMNSKLLFTLNEDSLEDGDLHAWEIFNMDLNAQMAVLSACNTGFGKIQKGEGVMSIGRAFAYAGCPSVVMSLWPAQDKITSSMMTAFYRHLSLGQTKDQALRQAKLDYLQHGEDFNLHPFYWAGFIVQGNTRSLTIRPTSNWHWFFMVLIILVTFLLSKRNRPFLTIMHRNKKTG